MLSSEISGQNFTVTVQILVNLTSALTAQGLGAINYYSYPQNLWIRSTLMINSMKLSRQNYHQKNDIRMQQCVVENFINRGQAEPRLRIHKSKISGFEKLAFKRSKVRAGVIYENGALVLLFQFSIFNLNYLTVCAPFDVRDSGDDRQTCAHYNNAQGHLLYLIDVADNCGWEDTRAASLPPALTLKFLSAAQKQLDDQNNGVVQLQIWRNFTPSDLASTTKMWAL
jgi:hypothetical protein